MAPQFDNISFDEWQTLTGITYEWAEACDTREYSRMEAIIAPYLRHDYSQFFGHIVEKEPKEDFLKRIADPKTLGGLVDCFHHIGGSRFVRVSNDTIDGYHQLLVRYKRFMNMEKKEVEARGDGFLLMVHHYQKIDGVWKLTGTSPQKRLDDYNTDQIFK